MKQHCGAVAELARRYGNDIGLGNDAYYAGLFHDTGKYGVSFQDVLKGVRTGIDHACSGAALFSGLMKRRYRYISESIAAHHGQIIAFEELQGVFWDMVSGNLQVCPSGKQPALSGRDEFEDAIACLKSDWPDLKLSGFEKIPCDFSSQKGKFQYMLAVRMLLSCLVDADYTVSGSDCVDAALVPEDVGIDSVAALGRLIAVRGGIVENSVASADKNSMRDIVYHDCAAAGNDVDSCDFYTLTAPTGSGKTLGMLRFALGRCLHDVSKKRIIIVLPFLSISDQMADIVREIIPDAIIDNSTVDMDERQREIASRWDAPCIITTTVQFFGSLFSDRPADCRKLHRMANSVILFDEVQALPVELSGILMQGLYELTHTYHACVCLSTATQPAYSKIPGLDFDVREIIKDVDGLFGMCRSVGILFDRSLCKLEVVAERALLDSNVCVIVNLKKHARDVYEYWSARGVENCFLISTDLCSSQRKRVLKEIKKLQAAGESVHVIATQCIEAGVDLDFMQVYRALAPLPSLIQAAGRMNRNGLYDSGSMIVFEPDEKSRYPGVDYEKQAMLVKVLMSEGFEIGSLASISEYYARLFEGFKNPEPVESSVAGFDYVGFARASRLIKRSGYRVIVPYSGEIKKYQETLDAVLSGCVSKQDLRKSADISVSAYDLNGVESHCEELVIKNHRTGIETHTGVYILLPGHESCYDSDVGLKFDGNNSMFML